MKDTKTAKGGSSVCLPGSGRRFFVMNEVLTFRVCFERP